MTSGFDSRRDLVPRCPNPHVVLLVGSTIVLVLEALRGSQIVHTSPAVPAAQACIAAIALMLVWRGQDRLRLGLVLSMALGFQLAWLAVHLANGVTLEGSDTPRYAELGKTLLSGHFPLAEYPVGAVLLFALEVLVGGGKGGVRESHALAMVPFQLVTVLAVWAVNTRWSKWFAALVALSPLNAFYWEFKFDSAPAAALAVGLVLALRGRWQWSAVAMGLGAALKWSPALAGLLLVVWLFAGGHRRRAITYCGTLVGTFLVVQLPFFVLWPHEVLSAYDQQAGRGITPEAIYYIPLRVLGIAMFPGQIWNAAVVPHWANVTATVVQVLALLVIVFVAAHVRGNVAAGVAVAGLGPVVFFLTNRVFSPQFFVVFVAAWAIGGSLLAGSAREQLALGSLIFCAGLANALVYPVFVSGWGVFSVLLFLAALGASTLILARALARSRCRDSPAATFPAPPRVAG